MLACLTQHKDRSHRVTTSRCTRSAPYLENVFPRPYICDIDPLAVDVVAVGVPAADRDPLLPHVVAGIAFMSTWQQTQSRSKPLRPIF